MSPLNTIHIPVLMQSAGDQIREAAQQIARQALAEARRGIQGEINEATAERRSLQRQLEGARSGSVREDLQGQIERVDLKIEKLQDALEKIEEKTSAATAPTPARTTFSGTTPPPFFPANPRMNVDPAEIVGVSLGILFVAFPLTLALVRFIWKRSSPPPPQALTAEQARRFDRLEQSVDAIAIEVERISENQRYLTRLLAEPKQPASVGTGRASH